MRIAEIFTFGGYGGELTSDGHGRAMYCLTGPQMATEAEQVHAIGEAIGRELHNKPKPFGWILRLVSDLFRSGGQND